MKNEAEPNHGGLILPDYLKAFRTLSKEIYISVLSGMNRSERGVFD